MVASVQSGTGLKQLNTRMNSTQRGIELAKTLLFLTVITTVGVLMGIAATSVEAAKWNRARCRQNAHFSNFSVDRRGRGNDIQVFYYNDQNADMRHPRRGFGNPYYAPC